MKLSTMLLPTGEFILIGSEVPPPHPSLELLAGLKDATGAAAVLFVEKDVETEDALFDPDAKRRGDPNFEAILAASGRSDEGTYVDVTGPDGQIVTVLVPGTGEEDSDESQLFTRTYFPHVTDQAGREFSVEFTSDGDDNLLRTLFGGGEFSPAGLVKSVGDRSVQEWADGGHLDIGGADPTIDAEHVDVDEVLAREPRLDSQTVSGSDRLDDDEIQRYYPQGEKLAGQFGRSPYTGPQNHDLNLDDLTIADSAVDAWNPQPGDIVLITGPAYSGSTQWVDKVGNIGVSPNGTPTGTWPVQFELEPPTGNAPFFSRRNLQFVAHRVTPDEMAGEDLLAALDG